MRMIYERTVCLTMRAADLVVGRAKMEESKRKRFPFRRLVLPPSR